MDIAYSSLEYWINFLTNTSFQEREKWVRNLIKKVKFIHHHIWTSCRIPAGILIVYLFSIGINPFLVLLIFLLFALTDWFDGKVYRMRNGIFGMSPGTVALESSKLGSILDGLADKCFVLPVIFYLGTYFTSWYIFLSLCIIEGGGNILIWLLEKAGYLKKQDNIFEHLRIGKIKFGLQVFFVCLLWIAFFISPGWIWWKLWVNVIAGIIILLAGFSVACKIRKENERFIPDFVTLGNAVCGACSMWLASWNIKIAAALIIIGAVCDALDGMLARKFKKDSKYGIVEDDLADMITFGLAPARLAIVFGGGFYLPAAYAFSTLLRLSKFTSDKFKKKKEDVKEDLKENGRNCFKGFPCPAAAILIASLFLWNINLPKFYIFVAVMACTLLMILFSSGWYHFINAKDLPKKVKIFIGSIFGIISALGFIGEAMTFFALCYLFLFQRNVADKLWGWGKEL